MELKDVSLRDLENFSNHPVWLLIEQELKGRIELARNDLERGYFSTVDNEGKSVVSRYSYESLLGKQHECAAYRFVINTLEVWKEEKKQIEESKNARTN